MKAALALIGGLMAAGAVASSAVAQNEIEPAIAAPIAARQSHMKLNAFNLGLLGAMAKGEIGYDAKAATAAAENLAALARLDQSRYWPPGSDVETLGKERTEALAKIWKEGDKFGDRNETLAKTTAAMAEAAGSGLDPMRKAMGPLAKACGGCHEDFRMADD